MRSWKTSIFAVLSVGSYVSSYFFPQHKEFLTGLSTLLIGGGLVAAKDFNVTGGDTYGRLLGKYGNKHSANSTKTSVQESQNEGELEESSSESKGSN